MAENLKIFNTVTSGEDYQKRLNELDQAIANVKKNITYLDTLNIVDAVTDKKNLAAQMNALTPNSSLVINTEPFNEGGVNYSRGDIILKDASDIIHHIPGQSSGLYYPKRITQPNLKEMNYNIEYEFINAIPTEGSTSTEVGSEVSNAAHLITFSGLGGGEAKDSRIYGSWLSSGEIVLETYKKEDNTYDYIEPMIEFYFVNESSMERVEIDYEIKTDLETVDFVTSLPKKYVEIPSNCWAKVK